MKLNEERKPFLVLPHVYWIPLNLWHWCKLGELCTVVEGIAKHVYGVTYCPTPELLVRSFVQLARPNSPRMVEEIAEAEVKAKKKSQKKSVMAAAAEKENEPVAIGVKLFRYSITGLELRSKEVPPLRNNGDDPPYSPFEIEGCSPDIFIPAGWAKRVSHAVQRGAEYALNWSPRLVGQPFKAIERLSLSMIHLGNEEPAKDGDRYV